MDTSKRALRRDRMERIKTKMRRRYPGQAPQIIGRLAETHGRPCSCQMCVYRDKFKDKKLNSAVADRLNELLNAQNTTIRGFRL